MVSGRRGRKRRAGVAAEELDPDRDISRPTCRSLGASALADATAASDASMDKTVLPPRRRRAPALPVSPSAFDDLTLHQADASQNSSANSSTLVAPRRTRVTRPPLGAEEFAGELSPVGHAITADPGAMEETRVAGRRVRPRARPVDPAEFSDLTIRVEEQVAEEEEQGVEQVEEQEATMANRTNKSLEETRVRARRVRGAAARVTAADFTDLTLEAVEEEEEQEEQGEKVVVEATRVEEEATLTPEQTVVADKRRTRPAARAVDAAEFSDLTLTEEVEEHGVVGEQRVVEEEVEEGGDTTQPRSGISSGYMEALGRDTDSLTLARERLTPQR